MRTVLLRHLLRSGTSHFDWMIQYPPTPPDCPPPESPLAAEPPLLTFRITCRIDLSAPSSDLSVPVEFLAARAPDHRPAYLTFEGEISGNRGTVTRLAKGDLRFITLDDDQIVLEGALGEVAGTFTGDRIEADLWRFTFQPRS